MALDQKVWRKRIVIPALLVSLVSVIDSLSACDHTSDHRCRACFRLQLHEEVCHYRHVIERGGVAAVEYQAPSTAADRKS